MSRFESDDHEPARKPGPRPAQGDMPPPGDVDSSRDTAGSTAGVPHDTVAGERSVASVDRIRSVQSRVSSTLALGMMLALGLGLLTWYYSGAINRNERAREHAEMMVKRRAEGDVLLPRLGPVEPPGANDNTLTALLGPPPPMPDRTHAKPTGRGARNGGRERSGLDRQLSGPVFVRASGSNARANVGADASAGAQAPALLGAPLAAGLQPTTSTDDEGRPALSELLKPTVIAPVQANVLPTQRLLLPKSWKIDCTLETAIDSSLPGIATCITATDTYSADASVVLIERGSMLTGETRGRVEQGKSRLFILWTEARTPSGVVIPLESPATDELGRSGVTGRVHRHFWARFGAAIFITVIDGAVQAATRSRDGDTVILNPSATRDITTEVLRETIRVSPTLRKNHGDRVQVLVARDVDFRSVYDLIYRPAGSR